MQSNRVSQRNPPLKHLVDPLEHIPDSIVTSMILPRLEFKEIGGLSLVSRKWKKLCGQALFNKIMSLAIGPQKWGSVLGEPDSSPALPEDIVQKMVSPCPIWTGKKVYQTHMLVMMPRIVSGSNFCLSLLDSPGGNDAVSPFSNISKELSDQEKKRAENAHWILMTKEILPESKGRNCQGLEELAAEVNGYAPPTILEAAASIMMYNLCVGRSQDEMIFKLNYTYCRGRDSLPKGAMWAVGGHSLDGLQIVLSEDAASNGLRLSRSPGVAAVMRL